jgi:hypothetical protein
MVTTLIDFGHFILGVYSLILILTGTPLNLLCFYIFKRLMPNRSNATIIVLSYLAFIELLIPFTWNLNYAIRELILKRQENILIKNLEQHSLFVCKLVSYSAYFLLQCSAWLKTLATFARCVSLHQNWNIKYLLKSTVIHRVSWITIFFIGLINLPIWIINGKRVLVKDQYNQTKTEVKCYSSKFFEFWEIVHLLLYNFIPFTLMILCNVLIIRHVHNSQRRTQLSKLRSQSSIKKSSTTSTIIRRPLSSTGGRLTKTLIFVTIFFIIFTSPSAIFYIFLGKRIKRYRSLITMGLSNLATTNHVLSFFIYWLTSTDFQHTVISVICCRPPLQRQTVDDKLEKRVSTHPPSSSIPISNSGLQHHSPSLQSSSSFP